MLAATVIGNLGQDPELRTLPDGTAVLQLSVASNSRQKKGAEWVDATTWVRVSLFGKRAATLHGLLKRGEKVAARGPLELREFTGKSGPGVALEMRADDVELLGGKGAAAPSAAPPAKPAKEEDWPF